MRKTSLTSNIILKICIGVLIIAIAILIIILSPTIVTSGEVYSHSQAAMVRTSVVGGAAIQKENCVTVQIPTSIVEFESKESNDIIELTDLIENCNQRRENAHAMAEAARALGYSEDNIVIEWASQEYSNATELITYYNEQIETLKQSEHYLKYPTARYVWDYFHHYNYSDAVCAGIIGNLMAETGGQTLNIIWDIDGNGYYGMVQWSKKYYPKVVGCSLEEQCDFLRDTIEAVFNTYGSRYKDNFNYSSFLALTNEQDAALAFAKCYERCGSGSYSVRQTNATKALNYFVD